MADVKAEKENSPPGNKPEPDEESDPYYVSSDSDSDDEKPPPMIDIGDRSSKGVSALKSSLATAKASEEAEEERKAKEAELAELRDGRAKEIRKQMEEGKTQEAEADEAEKTSVPQELLGKEIFGGFKDKFENMEETLAKQNAEKAKAQKVEVEIPVAGKQDMGKKKDKFERGLEEALDELQPKEPIKIERSVDGKKRIHKMITEKKEEIPPECPVCGKVPYQAERVAAERRHYHKDCFRCTTCKKLLGATTYNSHSHKLYCKAHLMAVLHPELQASLAQGGDEDEEEQIDEEEGDFVKVSKPKRYDPNKVVQSGLKGDLELEALQSGAVAKAAKSALKAAAEAEETKTSRRPIDIGLEGGAVKDRMSKIAQGGEADDSEEEDVAGDDPNVVRARRKKTKEELNFEVGNLKSKWETGEVETAEAGETDAERAAELQSLKGVGVKARFKERTGDEPEETRTSKLPEDLVNFSSEAREKFAKGEAFREAHPVERTAQDDFSEFKKLGDVKEAFTKPREGEGDGVERTVVDAKCEDLGKARAAFEAGPAPELSAEERAAAKKAELAGEFERFKRLRANAQAREEAERAEEEGAEEDADHLSPEERLALAERGNIVKRFEDGTAFAGGKKERKTSDVKAAVAGKARAKFQQIDASGAAPVLPGQKTHGKGAIRPDKARGGADGAQPEAVNKRQISESDSEEEEYEVASIMNKFRDIEAGKAEKPSGARPAKRAITPPPQGYQAELESAGAARAEGVVGGEGSTEDGLRGIKTDAKHLLAKFEKGAVAEEAGRESEEERRARLAAEFAAYKAEAEAMKAAGGEPEPMPEALSALNEEDLSIAAAHGAKMKSKWEKIERKEQKKAQKAQALAKSHKK